MGLRLAPEAWSALPLLMEAQGVGALCGDALRLGAPHRTARSIDDLVERTLERGRMLKADRSAIQTALTVAGLPYTPIKGAWIAEHAYSTPAARPMADTDLYVAAERMDRTISALSSIGFGRSAETWKHVVLRRSSDQKTVTGVIEHPKNPRPVELHPVLGESFRGIPMKIALDGGRLGTGNGSVDDVALVTHIAAHASVDALGRSLRLVSIIDITKLAMQLPASIWDEAIDRLPNKGEARFLYPALALAARELGAPIPRRTLETLRLRVLPNLSQWVDRQDIDAVGSLARGQVKRPILEIPAIWPRSGPESAAMWRFILWPRRSELADRYPTLITSGLWPAAYAKHAAYTLRSARRRLRESLRERN